MNDQELHKIADLAGLFQFEKVILLIIGFAVLATIVKLVKSITQPIYVRFPSKRLLISQLVTVFNFLAYIFGSVFLFYGVLKPPKELLFAAGGSIAVALGLSLKDLVASIVAGLILLFDRPFQVGDRVTFGSTYGEIKSIGLRAVRLLTLDDNLVTIPNSRFITDTVASANSGALDMMIVVHFKLSIEADLTLAKNLIYEVIATSRYAYLKKPIAIIASEALVANRPAIELTAKAYVLDVRFEKAFETDVTLRANEAFLESKILRPRFEVDVSQTSHF